MNSKIKLILMAGGSGTRFWPKSTAQRPKQLISFGQTQKTLIENTVDRFKSWIKPEDVWVVTTEKLSDSISKILPNAKIIREPMGRNTAPCLLWATHLAHNEDPNTICVVMASDHFIAQPEEFLKSVKTAAQVAAESDSIVTLGIRPTRPETGFGYLKLKDGVKPVSSEVYHLDKFVEKPKLESALQFLESGNYLWNAGNFVFKAQVFLKEFQTHASNLYKLAEKHSFSFENLYRDPEILPLAVSIDYAVMEKSNHVKTVVVDCGWDDIGSWDAIMNVAKPLGIYNNGNAVLSGEVLSIDSSGNTVDMPGKTVCLLGVEKMIIVENENRVLIAPASRAQEIKKMNELILKSKPELA